MVQTAAYRRVAQTRLGNEKYIMLHSLYRFVAFSLSLELLRTHPKSDGLLCLDPKVVQENSRSHCAVAWSGRGEYKICPEPLPVFF